MTRECQKRATNAYRAAKVTSKMVRFYPTDAEMLAFLAKKENFQGYVKGLIREDMKKERGGE